MDDGGHVGNGEQKPLNTHMHDDGLAPVDHVAERRNPGDTPLRKFFEAAVTYEASDILLRGGAPPKIRVGGVLKGLSHPALDPEQFEQWVEASLSPTQWTLYARRGAVDMGFDLSMPDNSSHRFRVNVFRTRGRSGIAARRVNNRILGLDELHLPPALAEVAKINQGLVLLAGVTGSGKSTTIAALIQQINMTRACHVVTIEDPIEYLFQDEKAMINQREVGIDVPSFSEGLRAMVRENPDVVLIGEMRDAETFEAALRASETGHLVLGTIHASSATQAFGRIYDLFGPDEREPIRNLLAYQMHAFVYQRLLPSTRPGVPRVPATEVLLQSPPTRKYILEGREHELNSVIKNARDAGMQTFTDSLVELVEKQYISPRTAQAYALNVDEVKMRLKGIVTG